MGLSAGSLSVDISKCKFWDGPICGEGREGGRAYLRNSTVFIDLNYFSIYLLALRLA